MVALPAAITMRPQFMARSLCGFGVGRETGRVYAVYAGGQTTDASGHTRCSVPGMDAEMTAFRTSRRLGRAIFVIAIAILATAGNGSGQVAQPPLRHTGPGTVVQEKVIEAVRTTLASDLDTGLPTLPLEHWLFVTLSPHVQVRRAQLAELYGGLFRR